LSWIALQLGLPSPQVVAAGASEVHGHRSNKRCRNTKLIETGYVFRYPTFREGYHALLTLA
jgi:hypothetical protein